MDKAKSFQELTGRRSEVLVLVVGPSSQVYFHTLGRGITFNNGDNVNKMTRWARKLVTKARANFEGGTLQIQEPQFDGVRRRTNGRPMPERGESTRHRLFVERESSYVRQRLQQQGIPADQCKIWKVLGTLWRSLPEAYHAAVATVAAAASPSESHLPEILCEHPGTCDAGKYLLQYFCLP